MLVFNRKYFFLSAVLFVVLVLIAVFVKDRFVRPYFGDYLVVIFLYCAAKTFLKVSPSKIAVAVLIFSYLIEVLQYFKFVEFLGLEDVLIAKTVIGYGFDWLDLIAYTLGILTVLLLERPTSKTAKKGYA
jgi:hypothetical protein